MKEIKIYHSLWKSLLLTLVVAAAAVGLAFTNDAICIVFSVIMGISALILVYIICRERLGNRPCITITDRYVLTHGKEAFSFDEIDHFSLLKSGAGSKMIGIYYKGGVRPNSKLASRVMQNIVKDIADGAQGGLEANGLSVSAEELLRLLNDRLH